MPAPPEAGEPPAAQPPLARGPRKVRALVIGVVIAAALAAFLFLGLGIGSNPGSGPGPLVGVGSVAPEFALPQLVGGRAVDLDALGSDRHRPVVLNFFASWCIPCQRETPLLARAAQEGRAKGSTVQFVGVDVADQPTNAVPFVQQSGITYPVAADSALQVTSVLYGLDGEPNTFFIDGSGHVIGHVIGGLSQQQLDRWLHRLAGTTG